MANGLCYIFIQKIIPVAAPGEAVDFIAAWENLRSQGEVLGISRDSPASHRKFTKKHGLGVKLVSDQDHKVTEARKR